MSFGVAGSLFATHVYLYKVLLSLSFIKKKGKLNKSIPLGLRKGKG